MIDRRLKERMVGAIVLVLLAVIFLPMILQEQDSRKSDLTETNIPPRPDTEFSSRLVPLADPANEMQAPAGTGTAEEKPATPQEAEPKPVVETSKPVVEATTAPPVSEPDIDRGMTAWVVQVGSFSSKENAEKLNKKLREKGYRSFVQPDKTGSGNTVYKVRVGPEILRSDANKLKQRLQEKMSLTGLLLQYP